MLKQRLITAALLIPVIIGLVLYASEFGFMVLSTIIMLMAAIEWLGFINFKSVPGRFIYLFLLFNAGQAVICAGASRPVAGLYLVGDRAGAGGALQKPWCQF